ncbi:uncharacterized protein LOC123298075 [Chrysoperla carnea]|uniref:uncharacterized protein LOC123298075 n=1 Tax=Chrysoperla carnea TaxID=189513 RepID=UPI001D074DD2|nr:uncharacterized protein LOC123298075 [Chrysoperla carnea]
MTSDKQNIFCLVLLISTCIPFSISTENVRGTRNIEISTKRQFSSKEINSDDHLRNSQDKDETLRMESAGGGKNKIQDNDDEDRKTLAQQVVEGKYGLIQKELFAKPVKSFGIISYRGNPEVPKDNSRNLGGLNAEDIWLAEDHLLILKGGIFPSHNSKSNVNWPPIDNYKAPRRQVKIPLHPKVPPPFPVQLQDNGPIEIIGPNGTTQTLPENIDTTYPPEGYAPGTGPFFPTEDTISSIIKSGNFSKGNGPISFPLPPSQQKLSPLPPFIASLPPNAVYLPPPGNQTDMYDEDDPSIYYPPPYSFYYSKGNLSHINPGPLVPGIILPPPPDFFGILEPKVKNKESTKKVKGTTTTPKSTSIKTTTGVYTTQIPPTLETTTVYKPQPIYVPDPDIPEKITFNIPVEIVTEELDKTTITTTPPTIKYTTSLPSRKIKPVTKNYQYYTTEKEKTIPYYNTNTVKKTKLYTTKPTEIPTTTPTPSYDDYSEPYYTNDILQNLNPIYTPPKKVKTSRVRITTTAVPLKAPAYFTTNSEIESNSVTSDPIAYYQQRQNNLSTRQSPKFKPQTQFYYYETPKTTTDQTSYHYFRTPTSSASYDEQPLYIPTPKQNLQYHRPTIKPETISSQIIRLQQEIQSYLTSPKYKIDKTTSKPIYEYSFQIADYAQKTSNIGGTNNDDQFRPITGFYYSTTPKPIVQYETQTLKPIPQYETQTLKPIQQYKTQTLKPIAQYLTQTLKPIENYDHNYEYDVVVNTSPLPIKTRNNSYRKLPQITTENPLHNGYYTKQDEGYLDEITKQYFTVFGQKLDGRLPPVTTPLPKLVSTTAKPLVETIIKPGNIEIKFGDNSQLSPNYPKKISLERDILVNYQNPRPQINPDSEIIPNITPRPISLESDILVNEKYPRPPINPNAEFIAPVNVNRGVIRPIINVQRPYYRKPNAESLEEDQPKQTPYYSYRNPNGESLEQEQPQQPQYYNYRKPSAESLGEGQRQQPPYYNYRKPNAESLEDDYAEDYNTNNNAQLISNSYVQQHPKNINRYREQTTPQRNIKVGEGQPGQFISFPLPGNGAHFYFLTPQVASVLNQQKQENGYLYPEPNQRLRRSRVRQRSAQSYSSSNVKR